MTKTDIANQICTHLNISAPSLANTKKEDLETLATAVGLVLAQPAGGTAKKRAPTQARPSEAVCPCGPDEKPPW